MNSENEGMDSTLARRTSGPVSVSRLRATLRTRRQDRAAERSLRAELASYTTDAEVADLLAALSTHDGAEAERMRSILTCDLARRS